MREIVEGLAHLSMLVFVNNRMLSLSWRLTGQQILEPLKDIGLVLLLASLVLVSPQRWLWGGS
jgi:hypothetical protein